MIKVFRTPSGLWRYAMLLVLLVLGDLVGAAAAPLNVVTTTSSLGALAREVGGPTVSVTVLAPPDRDVHNLDARPSFMAALRRADLLVEIGAGLEEGWLPAALRGAANPALNPGRPGHFRAADVLELRRSITQDGLNLGHVHAEGNPHFNVDPLRMATLGRALARRLGELRPEEADRFARRAEDAAERLAETARILAARVRPGQQALVYHEDLDYLEEWLPVEIVGYLEPTPGIPPTARHLHGLVERLNGLQGRVVHANFQPAAGAQFLERELDWPIAAVPLDPPMDATLDDYLALMAIWARSFEQHAE
jgi:zinc/manganese transport system substrate-binding protein